METVRSSKMLISTYKSTRCHEPEYLTSFLQIQFWNYFTIQEEPLYLLSTHISSISKIVAMKNTSGPQTHPKKKKREM